MAIEIKSKDKLSLNIDSNEKDNNGLFLTLKYRRTPSKSQVELSIKILFESIFAIPKNIFALLIFNLSIKF